MAFVVWTNQICSALLILAALAILAFLPAGIQNFANEPEDLWAPLCAVAAFGLLAILCSTNVRLLRRVRSTSSRILTLVNAMTVLALACLLAFATRDPVETILLALCAVGPTMASVATLILHPPVSSGSQGCFSGSDQPRQSR